MSDDSEIRVLYAEDEKADWEPFKKYLEQMGYIVDIANTETLARSMLDKAKYHVLAVDLKLPMLPGGPAVQGAGIRIAEKVLEDPEGPVVVVVSDTGGPQQAHRLGEKGAGYVCKAENHLHLREVVFEIERQLAKRQRAKHEVGLSAGLEREAEIYRRLLEASRDVIWSTDLDHNVLYISPSVLPTLGIEPTDFHARKFEENFHKKYRFAISEMLGIMLMTHRQSGGTNQLTQTKIVQVEGSQGKLIWVRITAMLTSTRRNPATPTGFHGVMRDATDQRRVATRHKVGPYLSEKWVTKIVKEPQEPSTRSKMVDISVLVCDVRKFTEMTMKIGVGHMLGLLNQFFDAISDVIELHNGTINEFRGDGVSVFFGAPGELPNHTELAVKCALEIQRVVDKLNDEWRGKDDKLFGMGPMQLGIGVSCGPAIVGNVGSKKIKKYTALGTTVNTAARVEAETRRDQSEILVTEAVSDKLKGSVKFGKMKVAELKGLGRVELYPVVGELPSRKA